MQIETEKRELIAENQLGTIKYVQGAKEQAMVNIVINKSNKNNLKTAWIDVKKAFDSIEHKYLFECIDKLNFPKWIISFIKSISSKWELDIRSDNQKIITKKIEKGVLKETAYLLFYLCYVWIRLVENLMVNIL